VATEMRLLDVSKDDSNKLVDGMSFISDDEEVVVVRYIVDCWGGTNAHADVRQRQKKTKMILLRRGAILIIVYVEGPLAVGCYGRWCCFSGGDRWSICVLACDVERDSSQ
jgi:hypothetical protein